MYRIIEHKIKHQFAVWRYSRAISKHYGKDKWVRTSAYYYLHENALRVARELAKTELE